MVHRTGREGWGPTGLVLVSRIHLVRHGRAAAGWDTDPDPGLDELGRSQAAATATELFGAGPPMALYTSPLRRCRETAGFLAELWSDSPVVVVPEVTEIPSPDGFEMHERVTWLRGAMAGDWAALGPRYTAFRDQVVHWVASLAHDAVVFSHFIAINCVIGACLDDDRVVIASLDNASVTTVESDGRGGVRLIGRGREADTLIR